MIVRALVLVLVLARAARADATFEDKAHGAVKVDVGELAWDLVATCGQGDDFEQRQCRLVRDARVAALRGKVLAVDGDPKALAVAKDPAKRDAIVLDSKLRVDPIEVDGATWYATGKRLESRITSESSAGVSPRALKDADEIARYKAILGTFRVEWLVQLGDNGSWWTVVGYRVIAPCDGSIVLARPPSQPVAADPKRCTPGATSRSATRSNR